MGQRRGQGAERSALLTPAIAPEKGDTLDRPSPGFRPLLVVRGLTLFNDHALKWLAIGLGKRLVDVADMSLVMTVGLVGLSLPYVLFSWLAGALADRHVKTSVIRWCKLAEVLVAAAAAAVVGFAAGSDMEWLGLPLGLWLLLGAVMAIGTLAALMTPALVGALPEIVPAARLSAANGLFALVSLLAILAGTVAGNWAADVTPLETAVSASVRIWPTAVVLGSAAVAGLVATAWLPRLAAADPQAPPAWNALARIWTDVGVLLRRRELAAAAAGIVFFWAIGAVAQANVDQFGTEAGATSQGRIVPLLIALVAGIGAGSLVTGRIAARPAAADPRVDLGFVPLGAAIMTVAFLALALTGGPFLAADAGIPWGPIFWLVVLGFGAGMFDVPLETFLQEKSPADRLGGVLAATNLLLFSGMFLASLAYGGLRAPFGPEKAPLFSARAIFVIFALLSLLAMLVAAWCAPRAALRMFVATIVHGIWRFRVRGLERIPVDGPVVMVANHLSWLDGFLLPMASPRPVRMVVYGPNIRGRFLRMLADQWRFILFDPRPKSIGTALKSIQSGITDGDAIGIFCEAGISRTGQLLGFKRGLEWLLEKVSSPIQPVSIDGLWGSGLSFSEGRYFTKRPRLWRRTITLTYGPPLPAGTHPDQARLALQEVTAGAVRRRITERGRNDQAGGGDAAAWRATAEAFDGCCLVRREDRLLASLAASDPLFESLGTHGGRLLGIRQTVLDATTPATEIVARLAAEKSSLWLARIEQAAAAAVITAPPALPALEVVVLPIGSAADLPRARAASDAFEAAYGIAPVVAYAPPEAGGLVAMNTPAKRIAWNHETITKPDTVGRVVNGVVVWPHAADREPLGLEPLASQGIASGEPQTLVIGATLPWPVGECKTTSPRAVLLADAFDVDKDGFLVLRG